MPRSSSWRWLIGLVILAVFVVFTERTVGWSRIVQAWTLLSPAGLGAAILLLFVSYVARAVRIEVAFPAATRGRLSDCLRLVLIHTFANNFLPVRSGELAFPVLMRRYFAVPPSASVPRLLWFRVLDAHLLALSAGTALLLHLWPPVPAVAVLALWLLVPPLAYATRRPVTALLRRRDSGRVRGVLIRLVEGIPETRGMLGTTMAWTAITWLVKLASFAWLLHAMAGLGPRTALLGAVGGELSSVLPLHGVAGAGTYEAGVLAVLTPLSVALAQALPAAVNLHLFILGASILGVIPAVLPWGRRQADERRSDGT